jgi:hypothetical protein
VNTFNYFRAKTSGNLFTKSRAVSSAFIRIDYIPNPACHSAMYIPLLPAKFEAEAKL